MKNISILILAASLIIFSSCGRGRNNSNKQQIAVPVVVKEIKAGSIKKYSTTTGNVNPKSQAQIVTEIVGNYMPAINPRTKKYYQIGDAVAVGEVLAYIQNQEYENNAAVDTKRISLEIAEGELEKLIALEQKGGATRTEIRNAELKVSNAKSSYENAQISLGKMKLVSPIKGKIVNLEYFTPRVEIKAGTPVVDVMDYSKMFLNISLSESTMNKVERGQEAYITHYSLPEDTIVVKVNELSPVINTETRTYKGVLDIDNKDLKLKPGMFVKADIVVDYSENVIVIPKDIVRIVNGKNVVFVADGTNADMREITIGIENDDEVEVIKGLSFDDYLIYEGYETLRERSLIRIVK